MPKLSDHEMIAFLAERGHLARIATVTPDGAPSVVPVWFIFEHGKVLITPRKHSAFLANLRRNPRVAITVDEDAGPYRKVLFEGKAEILFEIGQDRNWDDIYRRIACRYIDENSADYYLTETKDQPRALIGVDRANAKVTTWRMPTADEPYSGIWAQRYYEPGSKMAATKSGASPRTGSNLKVTRHSGETSMVAPMEHALTGLKVLDFTRALAGPSCTRMLVEMGADVIKLEAAPDGDMTRRMSKLRNERSLYYIQQNRGKKSFCVNLRDPRGMALVTALIPKVDVVVENFKPGTMKEMGLGYDRLRAMRDDIILCSISALGQSGPLAQLPGYDFIAQAYSGATSMIGDEGQTPYIPLFGVGDVNTGVHGALAILAALRYRDRTGKGQHLDVGLLDVYYHCHEVAVHQYSGSNGQMKPTRQGPHLNYVAPAGVFKVTGGWVVIMSFLHHWKDLCKAMSRADLVDDPKMGTDAGRLANRAEMIKLIEDWLATFPDRDSAVAHMQKNAVPCAPVLSIEETVSHPHLRARGTVRTIDDPIAGKFEIPGFPLRFSAIPEPLPLETPTLGQHNGEVLRDWLGRSDKEIADLSTSGVLIEGKY